MAALPHAPRVTPVLVNGGKPCQITGMHQTAVMTLRVPKGVKRGLEWLAARFGHKPAQLGARLLEESLRRRDFPHVDLRETAAGRVAYVGGTRFAVCWVAGMVPNQMSVEGFAKEYELPVERVRAARPMRGHSPMKSRTTGLTRKPIASGLNNRMRWRSPISAPAATVRAKEGRRGEAAFRLPRCQGHGGRTSQSRARRSSGTSRPVARRGVSPGWRRRNPRGMP